MSVRKSDDFIADVERQFAWYVANAGWDVADRYLEAVEATCGLLGQHPHLGPHAGFLHPRLRDWRFFLVFRPFKRHILFYEVAAGDVVMRRAMHGHRDLPHRLLEPPGTA
ncbi:MAG: type II toxin-antitoxin system RelE/ParE family toxin [Verrucomicrobia bacterium]|nr:type II toxin-antitoxin system RelE/ParE family toxin [Verrucomicrobiota bacterium]